MLIFTASLSIFTGIVFGLAPAIRLLRPNLTETLKEGGRGSSGARHRTQSVFVVVETAMALVLLVGAGLVLRSLSELWKVDPGFDPRNVLSFNISLTSDPAVTAAAAREIPREPEAVLQRPGSGIGRHDRRLAPHDRRFGGPVLARWPAHAGERQRHAVRPLLPGHPCLPRGHAHSDAARAIPGRA